MLSCGIDNLFEESRVKYHKQNAILRMLCKECNQGINKRRVLKGTTFP